MGLLYYLTTSLHIAIHFIKYSNMKCYEISWFREFECLGGGCGETCCRGWVIPLTQEDCDRFRKEKGLSGIALFLATGCRTNDRFNTRSGKCRFLGRDGLCRLQRSKGHDFIPWTCRCYPRFYRNYGPFEEACLDLSCIGAVRLFMKHLHDKELVVADRREVTKVCTTNDDSEYLEFLIDQRSQLMKAVDNGLSGELANCIASYSAALQDAFAGGDVSSAYSLSFEQYSQTFVHDDNAPGMFPPPAYMLNDFLHTSLVHPRLAVTSPALYKMLVSARSVIGSYTGNEEEWQEDAAAFLEDNPLLKETLSAYYSYYLFQYFLRTYETYSFRRQVVLGLCHTGMILLLAFCGKDISSDSLSYIIARYNRRAYFNDVIQDEMYDKAVLRKGGSYTSSVPPASVYRRIYEITGNESAIEGDCGKICGSVCCRCETYDGDEAYIYMLPHEEEAFRGCDTSLYYTKTDAKEHDLPASWGKTVTIATCPGPSECDRRYRPIQCRTYPLLPHINARGELELIYSDAATPYTCPLIYEKRELTDGFVAATYEAWSILVGYDRIRDLVLYDSQKRNRSRRKYEVVCDANTMILIDKVHKT